MPRFALSQITLVGSAALLFLVFAASEGWAQTAPIPDFSHGGQGWTVGPAQADLVAIPGLPSPVVTDPAHPLVLNSAVAEGKQPTFRIGDLSNPNVKQWAKDLMRKDIDEVLAGKIAFSPRSSCIAPGVPVFDLLGGGNFYFIQAPNEVAIVFDANQEVRRVHLNVPHSRDVKPSWHGESVGHYEGDTLVVDTIGFNTKTFVDNYRTPHSDRLHVVERWKMIENGSRLQVDLTVDDPETFNAPWQSLVRYRRAPGPLTEQVCAENNQVLFDFHIPTATTPDF
jgi:hypothetical protein